MKSRNFPKIFYFSSLGPVSPHRKQANNQRGEDQHAAEKRKDAEQAVLRAVDFEHARKQRTQRQHDQTGLQQGKEALSGKTPAPGERQQPEPAQQEGREGVDHPEGPHAEAEMLVDCPKQGHERPRKEQAKAVGMQQLLPLKTL